MAISSNKSMIGHLLGAAGGVEAVFTVKSIEEGVLPPTINNDEPGEECDLDYVPNEAREAAVSTAMCNNAGFGGANCSAVFSKYEG
jgi:3-oxoacyl-[acyl-carrier-protein] synthase II